MHRIGLTLLGLLGLVRGAALTRPVQELLDNSSGGLLGRLRLRRLLSRLRLSDGLIHSCHPTLDQLKPNMRAMTAMATITAIVRTARLRKKPFVVRRSRLTSIASAIARKPYHFTRFGELWACDKAPR